MRRSTALLVSLGIGFAVVGTSAALQLAAGDILTAGQLRNGLPLFALQVIMVAFPFLVMAMSNILSRSAWRVGLGLTLGLWAFYLLDALVLASPGRGANIGLGLVMLASPLLITLVCVAVARATSRRENAG